MTQYLYPQNLKATANLWLWSLRDFAILCIAVLLSALALVQLGIFIPAAVTLCFWKPVRCIDRVWKNRIIT